MSSFVICRLVAASMLFVQGRPMGRPARWAPLPDPPHKPLGKRKNERGQAAQWRVTQQAAISRPNPNRPRGPSWTSRRPTRSGQSRPRRRFPPAMRAFASPRVELADRGSHVFSPPRCEGVHRCAKFFEAKAEEGKRNGTERAKGLTTAKPISRN
jgi:hypothetical protein